MNQQVPAPPLGQGARTMAENKFQGNQFTVRQKIVSLGNKYYIYPGLKPGRKDPEIGFVQKKLLKLKEDIRIYHDSSMQLEIMRIKQEQIIDFSGSYQIIDSHTNQLIGILKRKGLKSMFKDEWIIMNSNRQEVGLIKEQGGFMWFMRRFILKWLPMVYNIEMGGQKLATIKEKTIALGDTYYLDLSADVNNTIDRRLAIASTIMMDVGEHQ